MIVEDQSEATAFLSSASAFCDTTRTVERRQTHISEIFIGAEKVFKLKRAVKFPYLDFSTLELRKKYCEAEVTQNRRTAPKLYLGVAALMRSPDGGLELSDPGEDASGEVLDWVVVMHRFDENNLLNRLAQEGKLDRRLMEKLADNIASFHAHADARTDGGGRAGIALTIEGNAKAFAENAGGILDADKIRALTDHALAQLDQFADLLEDRRQVGCVRCCHGDMHLRNIVVVDGEPVLFDAVEFNDAFIVIDVLYDLAFLLMDLEHIGEHGLANVTFNRYLDITGASTGLSIMALFLSSRAAIRSHVAAAAAKSASDPSAVGKLEAESAQYLDMALAYLDPPAPRLIAVGGLSGSGKSRLARDLASKVGARPGARVLRSDVIRKRIAGLHPLDRLDESGYTHEMTERTYQAIYDETRAVLSTGHSVIADCVFAKPEQRAAIELAARDAGVAFDGLWLEAVPDLMEARVSKRIDNASDADARIVRQQLDYDLGEIKWSRVDSTGTREQTDENALKALEIKA